MDSVNNPAHYTQGDIECIDAMISAFGKEHVATYCYIAAFKYIWRHDHKGNPKQDMEKARWYIDKYLELNGDIAQTEVERLEEEINTLRKQNNHFIQTLKMNAEKDTLKHFHSLLPHAPLGPATHYRCPDVLQYHKE